MLWYILYPIRGTTQPPRLSANHPIRRAFYRHGKTTAQHWLIAMLVSVAIAMGSSYPSIMLPESPAVGFASFPHHVWSSAKSIDTPQPHADIEMRQILIHGTYMGALDKAVLKHGLAIQEILVGGKDRDPFLPSVDSSSSGGIVRWGYHSPLAYWNNSAQSIDDDPDILKTINDHRYISSSLNVILRPTSVFAGRKFSRRRLLAADALVITLMNRVDDDAGSKWHHKMQSLTRGTCQNCTVYPPEDHATGHRVYEFGFTPLTLQEHIAFTFAYTLMAIYVLLSLRRIKAFHSRFGLVVTAITQMTCSILSSFTVCGMLKINLSMIPQSAYPFVVLVIGLENMFRLINAVLAYPPTMATEQRVANALGDVGPLSVAAAAQNLTILSLLSTLVSPGVAAFCAFAAIATLFDAFFLLTFFVAVLNVDIRRLELQDALTAKHGHSRQGRRSSPHQHTWFDALVQGRLPFSTRMAGTAVTTTFILSLNYHFFEQKEKASSLGDLLKLIWNGRPSLADLHPFASPPLNASTTPAEWMQMQDLDTATEIMQMAKPGADKFIIRVFAPFVVVLSGSDRTQVPNVEEAWTHAFRSFAIHHFYPVAVAVVFAVAFVAVLMNFLLYNEDGEDDVEQNLDPSDTSIAVQTIELPHKLDIVKIASSSTGHFVTVSLDKKVVASIADWAGQAYHFVVLSPSQLSIINWPVYALAIDDKGEWIACHGAGDTLMMLKCNDQAATCGPLVYPDDHPSVIFSYIQLQRTSSIGLWLIVLTSGGRLAMYSVEQAPSVNMSISNMPIVGAMLAETPGQAPQIIAITETSDLVAFSWLNEEWTKVQTRSLRDSSTRLAGPVGIEALSTSTTDMLLVTTSTTAFFVDKVSLDHVARIDLAATGIIANCYLFGPSLKCSRCGGLAFREVAVLSEKPAIDDIELIAWCAVGNDDPAICCALMKDSCQGLKAAKEHKQGFAAPGAFAVINSQMLLGLRKHRPIASDRLAGALLHSPRLRRRLQARHQPQPKDSAEVWQAYQISIDGELVTLDLAEDTEHDAMQTTAPLFVCEVGPTAVLDRHSAVVAFGNTVKIITASRHGAVAGGLSVSALFKRQSSSSRRRVSSRRSR